jgi:hypothetical protein
VQAQNYDLITECNLRKEQTATKKRLLKELMESVKETQMHMEANHDSKIWKKKECTGSKGRTEVPFAEYEKYR